MSVHQLSSIIRRGACFLVLSILVLPFSQVHAVIKICPKHQVPFISIKAHGTTCHSCLVKSLSEEEINEPIAGLNDASLQLFQQLASSTKKNKVVTSHSIQEMLSMLIAGSKGKTRDRLAEIMGVKPENPASMLNLQSVKHKSKSGKFSRYNVIIRQEGYNLRSRYKQYLTHHFDENISLPESVDFADEESVKTLIKDVNNKVCEISEDKITECLDPDELLRKKPTLLLANVTYFSYQWKNKYKTRHASFYLHDNQTMTTTMFTGKIPTIYIEHEGWESVTLPYKRDFEMVAILPPEGTLPKDITPELFKELFNRPAYSELEKVEVSIPEHEFSSEYDLTDILSTDEDGDPFSESADFTSMVKTSPLWISCMTHKAFIKTNRHGSTGGGVTTAVMSKGITHPIITFNRPFLFAIRDKKNQAMQMIGQVYRPKKAEKQKIRKRNDSK